jgi:spore coat protein A
LLELLPAVVRSAKASVGLIDPAVQPLFEEMVPNPLDPSFIYDTSGGFIEISVSEGETETGLVLAEEDGTRSRLKTRIWGYGTPELGYTWPGRTIMTKAFETLNVKWYNRIAIDAGYLLTGKDNSHLGADHDFSDTKVVDDSFHWAYSLPGYKGYSIEEHGTPIVPHIHGGHTDAAFDGNPEYFFTPEWNIKGPQWGHEIFEYDNSQEASTLW